jgi:hypothetical protein
MHNVAHLAIYSLQQLRVKKELFFAIFCSISSIVMVENQTAAEGIEWI